MFRRAAASAALTLAIVTPAPAQVPPVLEPPAPPPAAEAAPADPGTPSPWLQTPPVRPFPRLGNATFPPAQPGYFSALDLLRHEFRDKPPRYPYPPFGLIPFSFFDADFRYLDLPTNAQHDYADPLKRVRLADDNVLLSFGGDVRLRHSHEIGTPRLTGRSNDVDLLRTRAYGDFWYRDLFRAYAEFIDAQAFSNDTPPLPIDVNKSDLLNAFVDVKLGEYRDRPVYARVGRQELLYGSQRLISPLDWANTRRTFQGLKVFRPGDKVDVDLFWVQPVVVNPERFDSVDDDANFAGVWFTYRPKANHFFDLYYLNLNQSRAVATGRNNRRGGFDVHTVGTRYFGDCQNFLYDLEVMVQGGDRADRRVAAAAFTTGAGYRFSDSPLAPQFWVNYDYATGNQDPRGNLDGTFNPLFPFGHYYLGFIDFVGRQNIRDANCQFAFYPARWWVVILQYHHFELAQARDALYNDAGVPVRRDPTGRAGTDVGDEFDLRMNFHLSAHSDLLTGYSRLQPGEFVRRTGSGRPPEFFYAQYSYRW